jgi:hypothetical protein
MTEAASIGATLYALLFAGAALGKVDAWKSWRELTQRIFARASARVALRVGLPFVELGVAAAALLDPAVGLALAALVLGAFAGGVWVLSPRLAGERCNCFGAMVSSSLDRRLALRNGVLAAIGSALAAIAANRHVGPPSLPVFMLALLGGVTLVVALEARRFLSAARPDEQPT